MQPSAAKELSSTERECTPEKIGSGSSLGYGDYEGSRQGKLVAPERRRRVVDKVALRRYLMKFILKFLPRSKFLHVVRDGTDSY